MLKSINPHDPSDVIFEFEPAGSEGVHRAVAAGAAAFEEWSARSAAECGAALLGIGAEIERRAEELTELTVREVGKPVGEAKGEVARAMAICRYYSQMVLGPDGETYPASDRKSWLIARRHPLGVCALITPWNFPIAIPIWKAIPAVGYGNAVVLKPAPQSSAIADVLAEIFHSCVPPGVFQLTHGDAETGRSLVDHEDVAAVSFTGSVTVGHEVAARAAARGAKTQCEMGGQN